MMKRLFAVAPMPSKNETYHDIISYNVTDFIKEEEKRCINPDMLNAILMNPNFDSESCVSAGRKRARIDFLNEDQKMMRRY